MKKIISAVSAAVIALTVSLPTALAAESWREAFVTRLMKVMSTDPSYTDVVLTDIDRNGVPEAFVIKNSADGGISAGFTMVGNTIATINVPSDIIGTCLEDITVYDKDGRYIFVGREIPRYSAVINFYKLELEGTNLTATKIHKTDVSGYPTIPYADMFGNNFMTSGYPNRTKIEEFVNSYEKVNSLTAERSSAKLLVDGKEVEVSGYTVNNSNYYKIRDIAMILRTTSAKFDVEWDENLNAISILTGIKYTIVGGELDDDYS
ncbi:MAG: hypothetical protein LIO59_01285, partial [Oscillospiraceae bacterium]|nr:hypothetical protein [Oscillospiraceae bacterium]